MNIYQLDFIPTYLYIKQHSITGLLYFGKTVKDPTTYRGSGKLWKRHIAKHGVDHVVTLWCCLFRNKEQLIDFATSFSIRNNIVESTMWANLDIETGMAGGARRNNHIKIFNQLPRSTDWLRSQSESKTGIRTHSKHIQVGNICFSAIIDAATFYNVTEMTIYNWVKKGKAIKS